MTVIPDDVKRIFSVALLLLLPSSIRAESAEEIRAAYESMRREMPLIFGPVLVI